ncbi:hypothetical protein AAG570_012566 [Ranatra chinensis]|uniref:Prolyl-tRNA synthetase n=1 Tax=Ranatra chinensis TaxID=642074 RepID=A0ABD0YEJ2_9HEMI
MSTIPDVTSNKLPILLYQITTKFRDEVKPRCGLLRAREFLMKDLYSFDKSLFDAKITYNNICSTYDRIFENLNIPYLKVVGETGDMGGILSHEYHIPSDIGEDTLAVCEECNNASNSKLYQSDFCCVCNNKMKLVRSIEVGHTFLLGKRYSAPLQATFKNTDNSVVPLVMGSYGLGLTRILAACVEVLSPKENIKWPLLIAPYSVVIITPKAGSHGAYSCGDLGNQIYSRLNCMQHLSEDVLLDDRDNLTIGKRVWHARRTGYPYLIVIGEKATLQPPTVELLDVAHDSVKYLSYPDLIQFFNEHFDSLDQNISYQIS